MINKVYLMYQIEQLIESLGCTLEKNIWVYLEDKMIGKVQDNTIILWDSTTSNNVFSEIFRKKLQLIGFTTVMYIPRIKKGSFIWTYSIQINNTKK